MDMRGLSNFIAEIREVSSNRSEEVARVEQELGKIRSKFKNSTSLSAYDRKKYVCKLLFIFMLGYEVDFGHMEAVQLLSGSSPSEQLIGYLGITVLLHENHEIMPLTVHTMAKHLSAGDELQKALSLTALANVGTRDHAHQMVNHVTLVATNASISPMVRKKALLTALRLFRKYKDVVDVSQVAPAAVQAIQSPDHSVASAGATLALGFLGDAEAAVHVQGAFDAAVRKIGEVIGGNAVGEEYLYYGVPVPWLQVKLLRILQYFPPPAKDIIRICQNLGKVVRAAHKIVVETQQMQSNKRGGAVNRANSMVATLVEVISIAIHWDNDPALLNTCRDALGVLITDKRDANYRYLGLTLLTRLSFSSLVDFKEQVSTFQSNIVHSLHDPDNSIRKRALDLLYAMCGRHNAAHIVGELLDYLPVANPMIREDLVLMIAILAEKFCGEISWYVETILNIIEQAGDYVTDDIWQRVVAIIVNTPSVQKHAVGLVMRALSNKAVACHEVTVKVSALLLGEFGYQIALIEGSTPSDQLSALHSKFQISSDATKAMILTTYVKFYNLYDEPVVRERIKKILFSCRSNFDVDVQQRAAEYFALVSAGVRDEVLQAALEPMPAFDLAAGAIVTKLRDKQKSDERNLWSEKVEARDQMQLKESEILKAASGKEVEPVPAPQGQLSSGATAQSTDSSPQASRHVDPATNSATAVPDVSTQRAAIADPDPVVDSKPQGARQLSDLLGGGTPEKAPPPQVAPRLPAAQPSSPSTNLDELFGSVAKPLASASPQPAERDELTHNLETLQLTNQGTLMETAVMKIALTMEIRVADARVALTITNKHATNNLNYLNVKIVFTPPQLMLQMQPVPKDSILPGETITILFAARSLGPFSERPTILVSGRCGGDQQFSLNVPLPFTVSKFVDPYKLEDVTKFRALWNNTPSGSSSTHNTTVRDIGKIGKKALAAGRNEAILAVECAVFQKLRLHTLRASTTEILAIGAYATMPKDTVQFAPVMMSINMANDDPLGDDAQTKLKLSIRCTESAVEQHLLNLAARVLVE